MAHIASVLIKETSTSTGTGSITVAGALTGYKQFSTACSVGDTFIYVIRAVDGNGAPTGEWERGLGTYTAANVFARTTPMSCSSGSPPLNFSSGTKHVYITGPDMIGDLEDVTISQKAEGQIMAYDPTTDQFVNAISENMPLAGEVDGVNNAFTLPSIPIDGTLQIFANGIRETDFSHVSGTDDITLGYAPPAGFDLKATYLTASIPLMSFSSVASITQYGVTINFSPNAMVGRYISGDSGDEDIVVKIPSVGGLEITSFSTPSAQTDGRWQHGCMVIDSAVGTAQGFDDAVGTSRSGYVPTYTGSLNVDPGKTGSHLVLTANTTVVKAISMTPTEMTNLDQYGRRVIKKYIVLTCIPESYTPPADAFRPPVVGTDKKSYWRKGQMNYGVLRKLAAVTGVSTCATVISNTYAERARFSWLLATGDGHRGIEAVESNAEYGREKTAEFNAAIKALHSDQTNSQKERLAIGVTQAGIDYWGVVHGNGGTGLDYGGGGGGALGLEEYATFAALILDDQTLKAWVNYNIHPAVFNYDASMHDITQAVDLYPNNDNETYQVQDTYRANHIDWTTDEIGLPEWISVVAADNYGYSGGNAQICACAYRGTSGNLMAMANFGIELMRGGREVRGRDTQFKYSDRLFRWYAAGFHTEQYNDISSNDYTFWQTHRALLDREVWTWKPERVQWFDGTAADDPTTAPATQVSCPASGTIRVNKPAFALDNGSPILSYQIRYRLKHTAFDLSSVSPPQTTWTTITDIAPASMDPYYDITGKAAGTYFVQVRAVNALGAGPWTDSRPIKGRYFTVTSRAGSWANGQTLTIGGNYVATLNDVDHYGTTNLMMLEKLYGAINNGDSVTTSGGGTGTVASNSSNAGTGRWALAVVVVT